MRQQQKCVRSYLNDHVLVELGGVQANGLVEAGAGVIVEVHGDVHLRGDEQGA